MKILITGHRGFIGQNMIGYLQLQGHEVDGWEYVPNTCPPVDKYDWVVHLGAITSTVERDVEKVLEQNLEFSVRLVSLCDTVGTNFQYASSASIYGNNLNFKESGPSFPQSPYAWSKYLFDRFVSQDTFDITVQGFRYFNVYGHFEEHKKDQASPVTKFTQQARETGKIKIFENSEQFIRDFVCVEDVCRVHDMMFSVKESGIFNVGTGKPRSFREIAEAVAAKENAKIVEVPMPIELIAQYQTYTCADLMKLNQYIYIDWIDVMDWINRK